MKTKKERKRKKGKRKIGEEIKRPEENRKKIGQSRRRYPHTEKTEETHERNSADPNKTQRMKKKQTKWFDRVATKLQARRKGHTH